MRATTVVVGAGHCGLAVSRCLSERSIDHVVLERNEVASAWRRERWDSLRLLTPNWQCRLPGHAYQGDDADGYMHASQVAEFIAACRTGSPMPISLESLLATTRATLAVGASLSSGKPERV